MGDHERSTAAVARHPPDLARLRLQVAVGDLALREGEITDKHVAVLSERHKASVLALHVAAEHDRLACVLIVESAGSLWA